MAKKRGNNEGSISHRKDGRWEARYTIHTVEGPKRKVLYGKTRAEVAAKLTKAMADRDGGIVFDSGGTTAAITWTAGLRTPCAERLGSLPTLGISTSSPTTSSPLSGDSSSRT